MPDLLLYALAAVHVAALLWALTQTGHSNDEL